MQLENYLKEIESFLRDYLAKSKLKKYVLGVSGGLDSALVLALAKNAVGSENVLAYILPIHSLKEDARLAVSVCEQFNVAYQIIDLSHIFDQLVKTYQLENNDNSRASLQNVKVRLRMVTLYAYAQANKALVLGTDNASERYVGYFTKHGDGAADVMPIYDLLKSEVYQAAELLNLPLTIINKAPSAGLTLTQTDEDDLGFTYRELDDYLLKKKISKETKKIIERLHKMNLHKLKSVARPKKYKRD